MQIVMAYGEYPSTTGEFIARAFRRLGHEVHILALQKFRRAKPNIVFRYLERNMPLISWIDARRWLKWNHIDPDLFLWVESPRFVEVKVRRPFPCPSACYVIDTHVRGLELMGLARQYDKVFVAQRDDARDFAQQGLDAHWLPLGADPEVHAPVSVPIQYDLGFVGYIEAARYRERFQLLRALSQDFKVKVAKAYGSAMAEVYCQSRLGFNKSLKGDLNMRVFEIMCMGVPLITDRIGNGLTDLFTEGTDFAAYADLAELRSEVRRLLDDEPARAAMAKSARAKILQNHTYDQRVKSILSSLG